MRLWRWLRRQPPRPVNLHAVLTDGSVIPVECIYFGRGSAGQHVWVALARAPIDRVVQLGWDQLPPNTEVVLARIAPPMR